MEKILRVSNTRFVQKIFFINALHLICPLIVHVNEPTRWLLASKNFPLAIRNSRSNWYYSTLFFALLASTCTSNKVTGVTRAVIKRTCAKFAMAEHRPVTEIQFDGSEIPGKSKACQDSEEKKIYIYRERESTQIVRRWEQTNIWRVFRLRKLSKRHQKRRDLDQWF